MNEIEISVIVPVYKVEKYLRDCIDSILAQSFNNFELILIDDGSPDQCGLICDEYAGKDNRIKVIHQENGGLSAARNAGLDIITGNYVTFVDSDDVIAPNYLEVLYRHIVNYNCDISVCTYLSFESDAFFNNSNGCDLNVTTLTGRDAVIQLYSESPNICVSVTAWGKLYRNVLFKNIRFPLGKIHEDQFIIPIILYSSNQIAIYKEQLYGYRSRTDSIMNSPFTLKRYDGLDAFNYCINYFSSIHDQEVISVLRKTQKKLTALYSLYARRAGIYKSVSSKYRITELQAYIDLHKTCTEEKFVYYLNMFHPKLGVSRIYEYYIKIHKTISSILPKKN